MKETDDADVKNGIHFILIAVPKTDVQYRKKKERKIIDCEDDKIEKTHLDLGQFEF